MEPEPTTNQTKSISWDTIVNLPSYPSISKTQNLLLFIFKYDNEPNLFRIKKPENTNEN